MPELSSPPGHENIFLYKNTHRLRWLSWLIFLMAVVAIFIHCHLHNQRGLVEAAIEDLSEKLHTFKRSKNQKQGLEGIDVKQMVKQQQYLQKILHVLLAQHLLDLQDLRVERGKLQIKISTMDVHSMLLFVRSIHSDVLIKTIKWDQLTHEISYQIQINDTSVGMPDDA